MQCIFHHAGRRMRLFVTPMWTSLSLYVFLINISGIIAQLYRPRQRAYEIPVVDRREKAYYQPVLEANNYGQSLGPNGFIDFGRESSPRHQRPRTRFHRNNPGPRGFPSSNHGNAFHNVNARGRGRNTRGRPGFHADLNPYGIYNKVPTGGFVQIDPNRYNQVTESFGYGPTFLSDEKF